MIYYCPDCRETEETFEVCGMCRETTFGRELEAIMGEGCHCERTEVCACCVDQEQARISDLDSGVEL